MKESSNLAPLSSSRLTHFVCIDCNTGFSMSEEALSQERFVSNCSACRRPISIQANQEEANLQVLELFGCEYSFVGHAPTSGSNAERPQSSDQILDWIGKAKENA